MAENVLENHFRAKHIFRPLESLFIPLKWRQKLEGTCIQGMSRSSAAEILAKPSLPVPRSFFCNLLFPAKLQCYSKEIIDLLPAEFTLSNCVCMCCSATISTTDELSPSLVLPPACVHCLCSCGQEEPTYSALWGDNKAFDEVIISPAMLNEHMPHMVMEGLNKVCLFLFCLVLFFLSLRACTGGVDFGMLV